MAVANYPERTLCRLPKTLTAQIKSGKISIVLREEGAKNIKRLLGLFVALLVLLNGSLPVQAVGRSLTLETIGFDTDITVGSPYSAIKLDFPVPRLAKMTSASVSLALTPNLQLNGNSLFFFYYNNQLIGKRTAGEIRQQKNILLKLPVDSIARDFARIHIKSSMFISDDLCRDSKSGGLTFTVHKNSLLNLTYDMLPVRTVEDFFGSLQQDLLLVVPDDATLDELTPAAWIYGLVKRAYPQLNIQPVRAAELVKLPPAPRIWIVLEGKLPDYFKNKGVAAGITLVDPNTVLISAADVQSLRQYTQQIMEVSAFSADPAASKRVDITPVETPSGKLTEAIGFGNNYAQDGSVRVPVDFQLYPALLTTLPERLGLHLEGTHTAGAAAAMPFRMDVLVNNQLVHSSVLEAGGPFKRDILLPETLALRTRNDLSIQFYCIEGSEQCRVQTKPQSATILPTSYLWGTGQHQFTQFDWTNIGLFFSRPGTVLIDEALGSGLLKTAGEVVCFMNRQLPRGLAAFPTFLPLTLSSEATDGAYAIAIGVTGNIPANLQERMPVTVDKSFAVRQKITQASLFEQQQVTNSVVGRIGEMKGKPLVVVSANIEGALLGETFRYLGKPQNYDRLTGNVFVYQKPDQLFSFYVRDGKLQNEQPDEKSRLADWWKNNQTAMMFGAAALGLIILGLIVFRRMTARRQVSRETPHDPSDNPSDKLFK